MAQKYYAPAQPSCLTLTQQQGVLTRSILTENIMRMLAMDETADHERLTADEANQEIEQLNRQEYQNLYQQAQRVLNSEEMQTYMQRKQIMEGEPLQPVNETEINVEEMLDEFSLTEFLQQEVPVVEYE